VAREVGIIPQVAQVEEEVVLRAIEVEVMEDMDMEPGAVDNHLEVCSNDCGRLKN
jgi:hypothetical protein